MRVYDEEARAAQRIRNRTHYEKIRNDPVLWGAERKRMQAYCDSKRRFLKAYKETVGCVDCGRSDVRLDFDHRPGTVKEFTLGRPRCSWKRLLIELDKCEVRCSSCHTKRHWADKSIPGGRHCRPYTPNELLLSDRPCS